MPIIKPASDLQRNIGSIYDICQKTKEPVYITRNGESSLVVMDAQAYEEQVDIQHRIFEREMRAYQALMRGHEDVQAGRLTPFSEVRKECAGE